MSLWHFLIPEHLASQPPLIFVYNFLMEISFLKKIGSAPQPLSPQPARSERVGCSRVLPQPPPESSAPRQPPGPGETRASITSYLGHLSTKGQTHSDCNCPEDHGSTKQEQLEMSFQIVPPNTGSSHRYRKHYSFSVKFWVACLFFFFNFVNMSQTKQFSHSCF